MPRPTIRNLLLLLVGLTWAIVTVIYAANGIAISMEYWLIPVGLFAGIIKAFPDGRPPDDRGEA